MIYHVYANKSNIGDWLSAIGIQGLLEGFEIVELHCDQPFVDEAIERLRQATQDDLVVIGGGGLFMDYFEPFWERFRTLQGRLRYCIWGVGYCDLKQVETRIRPELVREVVAAAELCVVRDQITLAYIGMASVEGPVICPSVCAIDAVSRPGLGVLHVANFTTAGAEAYGVMRGVCRRFARETNRPFRETSNRIDKATRQSLEECLRKYERSDLIVSSALHGCVIGLAMGRKVLAVSGDRKIDGFMELVGLHEWVIDAEGASAVRERIACLDRQPDASGVIEKAREDNRMVAAAVRKLAER